MATSDRGLVDVERFDHEPQRPILHGLLGEIDAKLLPGMTSREKIPHILRHLDAERLSPRTAASLVEVDRSLSTWPQLAADVNLGATVLAEAVRRIGLGEPLGSGRTRVDVGSALDQLREPEMAAAPTAATEEPEVAPPPTEVADIVAAAAHRAPSGGNVQPWIIETAADTVTIRLAAEHTSALDVGFRGSAVAIGAATFNARVAAAANGHSGSATVVEENGQDSPLTVTLRLGDSADGRGDPTLAELHEPMLRRVTNRRHGRRVSVPDDTVTALKTAAQREGAHVYLLTGQAELASAATVLAAADRPRYLTAQLHTEMISELRWPGDPEPDTGIDIRSLELDASEDALLAILRRGDVMAHLADWNAGTALGDLTRDRVAGASALAVITVNGCTLTDFARGGSAAESVWICAEQQGLAVQPMSPVFLYARTSDELAALSAQFGEELGRLRAEFRALAGITTEEELVLVLRLTSAEPPSVPSRRSPDRIRLPSGRR
jgi:hypothetical protein